MMADRCFLDPRGVEVWFFDYNFPKLIKLCRNAVDLLKPLPARARVVLAQIRTGTFRESEYTCDIWRLATLLSLPGVLTDPDSIHPNIHGVVEGDTVYVKRYAKAGDPYRLAFTLADRRTGKRIVTTAFWAPTHRVKLFAGYPALWENQERRAAVSSGP